MLKRILLAAIAAGLVAGVLVTVVQAVTTTPMILVAETYDGAPHSHAGHGPAPLAAGVERSLLTLGANLAVGIGFGLLVTAGFALSGKPVDGRRGVLWGMAGFAVFTLAPALGLPPELPGTLSADLLGRQAWWSFAASAAAGGLWLLLFGRGWPLRVLGLAVAALPHVLGAPHPEAMGGSPPPELAARFAAAAIVVNALFWAALGWSAGALWQRLAR